MLRRAERAAPWPLRAALVAVALVACTDPPAPTLAGYLRDVVAADALTRARAVASWQLDEAAWRRTIAPAFQPLYADYVRAFAREAPAMLARLAQPASITTRRHFAGDAALTPAQARARWALPTLFPSLVADLGDAPLDTVFVADGDHWRALIGLDTAVRSRVAAVAPACAAPLALAGPTGRCSDAGAAIVTAALRNDRAQLAHLCPLAAALCGKGSP